MEFFYLIIINIIMGTIFYLVLKLKLERYASDYREKRLKREMDEIICEFNETAERNISILENRIEIMNKVLTKSGISNRIDINIDDQDDIILVKDNNSKQTKEIDEKPRLINIEYGPDNSIQNEAAKVNNSSIKFNTEFFLSRFYNMLLQYIRKFYNHFLDYKNRILNIYTQKKGIEDNILDSGIQKESVIEENNTNHEIKRDTYDFINNDVDNTKLDFKREILSKDLNIDKINKLSEIELENMFATSDDKYLLISELYKKGYPAEIISRCSGIPIGEIKLVLDLNCSL